MPTTAIVNIQVSASLKPTPHTRRKARWRFPVRAYNELAMAEPLLPLHRAEATLHAVQHGAALADSHPLRITPRHAAKP